MAESTAPDPAPARVEPAASSVATETQAPSEKHLEIIQAVISRMAGNSFLLKGWAVTLVTGLVGLKLEQLTLWVGAGAFMVILLFGGMDAYYLYLEQAFRKLYTRVIDDSIGAAKAVPRYSMDISPYRGRKHFLDAVCSAPILIFYGALGAGTLVLLLCSPPLKDEDKSAPAPCAQNSTSDLPQSAQASPTVALTPVTRTLLQPPTDAAPAAASANVAPQPPAAAASGPSSGAPPAASSATQTPTAPPSSAPAAH